MTTSRLDVWLYGTHVATVDRTSSDRLALAWTADALARWGEGARVLSATLPIGNTPVAALVANYLDGLLPEGNARTNHALAAGVSPDNTFGMIRAYGRDTPGAAIFVEADSGDPTQAGRYEPISLEEVATRLRNADEHSPARSVGGTGESSTLPGMVPKITVHRDGTNWFACKDGAASTWIIKRAFPDDSGVSDVIDTEVASLALAREIGVTTIDAEVLELQDSSGRHRAIAVSRYDRLASGDDPRLHQEDLAQAIGLNTSDPNRKFQWGSRMPSLRRAADVLRVDGGNRDKLLRLVTFSHLVGNTDMHAKNISFKRLPDGRVRLAPAYDVAMHLHHPREGRRFALDVNGKHFVTDITVRDLIDEAVVWGLPVKRAERVVLHTTTDLGAALDRIDHSLHPGVSQAAWETVAERVHEAAKSL